MGILKTSVFVSVIALVLNSATISDAGVFNAIVPNLSSGWFAKPGPTESLVFGLMVLKVMALRLAGIFPYNLNQLWADGLSDSLFNRRAKRFTHQNDFSNAFIFEDEVQTVERMLLALRRIDSHDCFIRHVCEIKQRDLKGSSSEYERTILNIFSLKPRREAAKGETSIWDIYHSALSPEVIDCDQKYKMCPLSKKETSYKSILSGLF